MVKITVISRVDYAVIGGSSTFSIDFPDAVQQEGLFVLQSNLVFATPYGESPSFKHFQIGEKQVLTVKMHGWRMGVSRRQASQQVFWVLQEAGVKVIIAEGGVGSINHLLKPRDLLVPSDYLDFSLRKNVSLGSGDLLIMRQAVCPVIRKALVKSAETYHNGRVFDRGVYAVTDGRHFESPAEIAMLGRLGADIVGQSMCPEVYLAREIGACYGRLDQVVNFAEGVIKDWDYDEFTEIFYNEASKIALILLKALQELEPTSSCSCRELRKSSLLQE